MTTKKILSDIIQALKDFEVVSCNLVHEKVLMDNKVSKVKDMGGSNHFERKGLCTTLIRERRLGCAHTHANSNFINLLKEVEVQKPEIKSDAKTLENIILQIYLLDHHKGELEKKKAEYFLHRDNQKIQQCEEKLKTAIKEHQSLVKELEGLKTQIIQKLENSLLG